ncbi:MAG TPA: lysylphosphatidylglycerol synthase transmembrane domain-containing protein [Bacteroidia bacterium]|nr:lysylphosphatidylglycerol synthase transmembrane domain-containing protein [Bacteroidia bacterium]HRU66959.1 lysylphosphatidylglycerol synthase transmembrane domain-containing protein [Bacteroidia bacterium]
MKNKTLYQLVLWMLRIMVFAGAVYYIWLKTFDNQEFQETLKSARSFRFFPFYLLLAFILMPVNWLFEAFKWKKLLESIQKISLLYSLKAVWAGLTINNWVPNRMAEFLGRMLFLKKENMGKSVSCTLAGGFAQFLATVFWGILFGAVVFAHQLKPIYWICLIFIVLLLFLFYFKIQLLHKLSGKIGFLSNYTQVFNQLNYNKLILILTISSLRYFVYLIQYYFCLMAFGIELPFLQVISSVAAIFLIQTFLPAITITEIGTRGAVILFVFQAYQVNEVSLLAAAYALFSINILLPSLAGAVFMFGIKKQAK